MSAPAIAWEELLSDARGWLGLEDGEPVPTDELLEQAKAVGYSEQEARESLRETDVLEYAGDGPGAGIVLAGDETPEDDGLGDETPGLETRDSPSTPPESDETTGDRDSALEAFADAVEFFHRRLDTDLSDVDVVEYDTPREAFRDGRGWADETIDAKRLGWAPANDHALLDYLMQRGYDRDAILGTGLFWPNSLEPVWKGRFVLPYFDECDRPTFAISRRAGEGHPTDRAGAYGDGPAKYHKVPVSAIDECVLEEPIYGLETVDSAEPVLITEGVADAITAHQAGYPCLSPVTTSFKRDDRKRLAEILEDRGVGRVYVVNDAEPPTADLRDDEDVDGWDQLHLEQYGEGVRGAVRTAAHLAEDGIDARIGELPQPAAEKVDLDDYLTRWDGDLRPILATARRAKDHSAYDPKAAALEEAQASRSLPDTFDSDGGNNRSRLYDLGIRDVTGLDWGHRGPNPLGHHGDSENYFTLEQGRGLAYDFKYKAAYNALTYLLCEAGERDASRPNGSLDDREHFAAWKHAKEQGLLPEDDPIPRRALRHVARNATEWDGDLAEYETSDGESFEGLPTETYNAAIGAVETEYGLEPGRDPITRAGDGWDTDVDPLDLEVVLDPELAHTAAGDVSAEHFDDGGLETLEGISPTTDGERWMVDGREDAGAFDVVRAVAIAEGIVDPEKPMDGEQYTHAYDRARDAYGAPLPEYVDGTTATDRWHVIQGAVSQLTHWHLSSIRSRVTGLTEDDDTLAVIDPCWADSASGERVVAFRSGAFYDRDAERTIDPLRFVALENGLIDDPSETLSGAAFKSAYHLAREEYGAPLPEWNVGNPSHVAVLPPAEDLLGEFTTDADRLDRTRKQVEQLYRDVAGDERTAHLLTPLPALGKTTSVAKNADEYPALYLAPRNELSGDMAQKADKYGRSWMYLPTFAEGETNDAAILEAAQYVREQGKDVLRDRDALADAVESPLFESDDTTEIDRDSCPTASGEHGEAWALAVHAARELGHTPQEIHNRDLELFGERLPCHAEDGEKCPYSLAWERATDPESPKDILIGHYVHAHVAGARTYYHKQDDRTELEPRTVVVDEFPEDAYAEEFGEDARDHATWLAGSLRDVGDWHTLLEDAGDLWSDEWVRAWCHGDVASADDTTRDLLEVLDAAHDVARAIGEVQDVRETYAGTIAEHGLEDVLETVPEPGEWTVESGRNALSALRTALKDLDPSASTGSGIKRLGDETLEAIGTAVAALENSVAGDDGEPLLETTEELLDEVPIATDGELRTLLEDAVDAYRAGGGAPKLESARAALEGGRDGCRELAVASDDGYAHPRAHLLLYATIAQDTDRVSDVETPSFSFNETDGTTLKRVRVGDNTVLFDRNHHGALVHSPPELRDRAGSRNSFIGLDATGREELWRLAIGRNVKQVDPHETLDTRRRFLREVLNVQIVQTSRNINTYSGNPDGKNFDEDLELCKRVGEEYGAQQLRRDTLTSTTKPGVITTKKARRAMGDDLEEYAEAVDHYGNVTGSNAMGDLNVGIVLGTRHFGDAPVEKWAALAGEEVSRSGHGTTLDYGSDVANTYLKHMREDETMQAILRFGRDEEGAVVFAHTAALRDDLPVVADADVVRSFSPTIRDVAETLPEFRRGEFTVSDVAEHVDRSRRSIQRAMAELAELGYLEREEPGEGRANEYDVLEQPGRAEVSIPEVEGTDPDKARMDIQYTVTVGVRDGSGGDTRPTPGTRAIIPSPDGSNVGDRASTGAK